MGITWQLKRTKDVREAIGTVTSDSGGDASDEMSYFDGLFLKRIEVLPDADDAPTADYDMTVLNEQGFDMLDGGGADLPAAADSIVDVPATRQQIRGSLTPTFANMGDSKVTVVHLIGTYVPALLLALLLLFGPGLGESQAAGSSLACSASRSGAVYQVYCLATSDDATGAVSGTTGLADGMELERVVFVPNLGATQPTNLFDVTLKDDTTLDVLGALGANIVNTGPSASPPFIGITPAAVPSAAIKGDLTFAVTNAGNSKTIGFYLIGTKAR